MSLKDLNEEEANLFIELRTNIKLAKTSGRERKFLESDYLHDLFKDKVANGIMAKVNDNEASTKEIDDIVEELLELMK